MTDENSDEANFGVALVDRLCNKVIGYPNSDVEIDSETLIEYFEKARYDLYVLRREVHKEALETEQKCKTQESLYHQDIEAQQMSINEINENFIQLDRKITEVSGKIVHLGEQLERRSSPRKHLEEAKILILEFYKFIGAGGGTAATLANNALDDENQLVDAAIMIRNLNSLCLELPDDEKFLSAKQRVTVACQNLDTKLLHRFRHNLTTGNLAMLKRITDVFDQSKSHSSCSDIYVEEKLKHFPDDLGNLCGMPEEIFAAEKDISKIFRRPDFVLMSLLQAIFTKRLKAHLVTRIKVDAPSDEYLANLFNEYQNVQSLVNVLSEDLNIIVDSSNLDKLQKELFAGYLTNYIQREIDFLENRLTYHVNRFFDSVGHQRRQLKQSAFNEFLRIAKDGERNDYEQCLLSQETAINIIDDIRIASRRCLLLSSPNALAENGKRIFDILVKHLITNHVEYGVALALEGVQLLDSKAVDDNIVFFTVIQEGSRIFHFFEKSVNESIAPLINASPSAINYCSSKRQIIQSDMESKFNMGLEKCLNLTIQYLQMMLSKEQKSSDFRSEPQSSSEPMSPRPSSACRKIVAFIDNLVQRVRRHLDGQNLKVFTSEMGKRFQRILLDHFYNYTYSNTGRFIAMQDVTSYRETARQLQSPEVDYLFDVLLKLMSIMLIQPANLRQVSQDYLQSGIPRDLIVNFVQLRSDCKSAKLLNEISE